MRKFGISFICLLLLAACASKQPNKPADKNKWLKYENAYFTVEYPSYMRIDESVNDDYDTLPMMSPGIDVHIFDPGALSATTEVFIRKSVMPDFLDSPEEWRDYTCQLKQLDPQYLGVIPELYLDTLDVDGHPAAMVGFLVSPEPGDTFIQQQCIVTVDGSLYYINNQYPVRGGQRYRDINDSIISSIRFK